MREELEPCPFCWTTASHGVVTEGGEANPDFGGHFIQCDNPNCHGCMGLRFACGDDPKPHLAAAWNTRAPDPRIAALTAEVARKDEALRPFAECVEQIADDEDDEEWAKFRLLIKDYRRTRAALEARND